MARIFITGSADGLGQLAAKALIARGHRVVAKRFSRGNQSGPSADVAVSRDF